MDELLNYQPPESGIAKIHCDLHILNRPIYQKDDGHIWSSRTYCARLRDLGFRAGYGWPPTNHDFRAEGLFFIDKMYTTAQRKRHAGHGGDNTFEQFYQPRNPGTDGQAVFLGGTPRTLVNDLFRGITLA